MAAVVEPLGQRQGVGRDERHGLRGESAKCALVAAMAGRAMLRWRALIVDMRAETGRLAENRLELGGDRGLVLARIGRWGA